MDVIRITLHSDLCAGNGESRGNAVDTDIVLTAAGLPRIPARRLKGCLRAAAGELAALGDEAAAYTAELFGDKVGRQGCLWVGDAALPQEAAFTAWLKQNPAWAEDSRVEQLYTDVRGQTRLKDGVADDGSLRFTRVLGQYDPLDKTKALVFEAPVRLENASPEAVRLLDWFLTELAHRNIPVLAIAGNHDSAERLDYAAGLLSNQQVYLAGQFTSAPRRVILQDEFGELTFDLLPFVRPATVRHCLPDADIRDEDSAIAAALGPLPTAGERRVLIAHQMVLGGGSLPTCSGSESVAADVNVGTVQAVDAARFTGYLYTALGHIHRPQQVGCPTVRYAGSPLCYSLDESGAQKSAVLVHIGANGAEPELLPLRPLHAMRHLTGPLNQLTAADTVTDAEDYIWATLTDPVPRPDAMAVLRAAYPNAMKLDYAPGGALDTGSDAIQQAAQLRTMSFDELFARFFEKMHGRTLTPEETAALAQLRQEAGL